MNQKQRCERCGEKLQGRIVWLEMDTRTDTYSKEVPEEHSLGAFPFGAVCARRAQAEHDQTILLEAI